MISALRCGMFMPHLGAEVKVYLKLSLKFQNWYTKSWKNKSQWSNSSLHRAFVYWNTKCWSLFSQFKMVLCKIICDVTLVLLTLQFYFSLFFLNTQHFVLRHHLFLFVVEWLDYISPFLKTFYATKHYFDHCHKSV